MMKILLVAATWMEVNLVAEDLGPGEEKSHLLKSYHLGETTVDILVTGIGTVFSTFHLTNVLRDQQYDWVLNIGIAGSLTDKLKIGEVVAVVSDEFADLGVETPTEFLTLFEAGFVNGNDYPFENGALSTDNFLLEEPSLRKVRGITANTTHHQAGSIDKIKSKFSAYVESTEGAAVLYVCRWMGVNCFQIRAISNFVETTDISTWNIPLALENLQKTIRAVLQSVAVRVH